ncbi:TPA: nitroreductase, partial [Clostridioides difficile]|nr:nitroreductase [Clostridioides difficile]
LEAETGFEKGEYFLGAMLALGVPEDNLKSPSKKPVEEICTFIK